MKKFPRLIFGILLGIGSTCLIVVSGGSIHAADEKLPALVRFIRIYGGSSEILPPVLLVNQRSPEFRPVYGERSLTLELDVQATVPPDYRLLLVHCRADWSEDNNVFLNDVATLRSAYFDWQPAPPSSRYYTYRAKMSLPNATIRIPYGGNWKVKVYDSDNDTLPVAETKFFALDCAVDCSLDVNSDFYEPTKRASPSAVSLDCSVNSTLLISDLNLHSAVFYRLHRWNEPFVVTSSSSLNFDTNPRYTLPGMMSGIAGAGKRFIIHQIPAENDYRVLDLSNLALFPYSTTPLHTALSDLPRYGSSLDIGDDAAMISSGIEPSYDDYVPVKFVLDPQGRPSDEDVFVVGSFNNWKADAEWQMHWNEKEGLYTLVHWIRRARHNYYYGTGYLNADSREAGPLSFEEFEGNNVGAGMTFVCFLYYHDLSFGGYDNIVGVSAASIFGPKQR